MPDKENHKNTVAFSVSVLFCLKFETTNSRLRFLVSWLKYAIVLDLSQWLPLLFLWPDTIIS